MQFSNIRKKIYVLGIALFILLAIPMAAFALPAFPGAMGWGSDTVGGRSASTKLYKVNTFADNSNGSCSGSICTGSLRYALTASGPRIIIFTVGGTITLQSPIGVFNPYLTVAGQTAPGGGIQIHGPGIKGNQGNPSIVLATHDGIIRGLRIRDIGDGTIYVLGNRESSVGTSYNFIIDHNSLFWGSDSMAEIWHDANHVTYSNNIIAEATAPNNTGALSGSRGGSNCTIVYVNHISWHHNLFAHNNGRNPLFIQDAYPNETVNNVVYNYGNQGTRTEGRAYIAKNVYIPGPSTTASRGISVGSWGCPTEPAPGTVMVSHNIGPGRPTDTGDDWNAVEGGTSSYRTNTPPWTLSGMIEDDVSTVKDKVLTTVGATIPYRDSADIRIVNDVINGTGRIIDDPSEVGGWPTIASGSYPTDTDGDGMPDVWETAHGLNPSNSSDSLQYAPSGYLWIEEYINSFFPAVVSSLPSPFALTPNSPIIIGIQ